jgi:hypothetical protein
MEHDLSVYYCPRNIPGPVLLVVCANAMLLVIHLGSSCGILLLSSCILVFSVAKLGSQTEFELSAQPQGEVVSPESNEALISRTEP